MTGCSPFAVCLRTTPVPSCAPSEGSPSTFDNTVVQVPEFRNLFSARKEAHSFSKGDTGSETPMPSLCIPLPVFMITLYNCFQKLLVPTPCTRNITKVSLWHPSG